MPIKESLQALMKQEGWTAEQVTAAIKKLQDVSVENCNLKPYILIGAKNQKILECLKAHSKLESLCEPDLTWYTMDISVKLGKLGVYRINPDFVIPDLEETPPRYESGTWRVDPNDGEAVVVVDREEWYKAHEMTSAPHEAKPDWWALKTAQGIMWEDEEGCLPLPPRHDLPEGWEYTGKAAKIDGAQELAKDEVWLDIYGDIALSGYASKKHNNQWRHLARKKKEEPKPVDRIIIVKRCHPFDCPCYIGKQRDYPTNMCRWYPGHEIPRGLKGFPEFCPLKKKEEE